MNTFLGEDYLMKQAKIAHMLGPEKYDVYCQAQKEAEDHIINWLLELYKWVKLYFSRPR